MSLPEEIAAIRQYTETDPQNHRATVDLENRQIQLPDGEPIAFEIDAFERTMLIKGLDYIDYSLQYAPEIDSFIERDRSARPWAYR